MDALLLTGSGNVRRPKLVNGVVGYVAPFDIGRDGIDDGVRTGNGFGNLCLITDICLYRSDGSRARSGSVDCSLWATHRNAD